MKKFIVFSITFFTLGMVGCSSDEKEVEPEPVDTTLKLKAEKVVIEPFEKLTIRVDVNLEDIDGVYDSLRWNAAGLWNDGIIIIPNNEDSRDVHFTNYRLGKHKITLLGYKGGKVVSSPSVEYEVIAPRGDFLNVKWGVEKKFNVVSFVNGQTPLNYLPTMEGSVKYGGVCIERWHIADSEKGEYVDLHLIPWSSSFHFGRSRSAMADVPNIEDIDWHPEDTGDYEQWKKDYTKRCEMETEFLYNYMIALYGEPVLEYKENDPTQTTLWDEYNKRFNNPPRDGAYPCVIWDTATSYVAMNHHPNNISNSGTFKGIPVILAEPKTKK